MILNDIIKMILNDIIKMILNDIIKMMDIVEGRNINVFNEGGYQLNKIEYETEQFYNILYEIKIRNIVTNIYAKEIFLIDLFSEEFNKKALEKRGVLSFAKKMNFSYDINDLTSIRNKLIKDVVSILSKSIDSVNDTYVTNVKNGFQIIIKKKQI